MDKALNVEIFFENSFDLLCIVGSNGYFLLVNPAFERTLGYTEQELLNTPLAALLHPDDVAKTASGLGHLKDGVTRIASINRYRCRDGAYKTFSWNTVPDGGVYYSVGRDITQQVQDEVTIRKLNEELEQKNVDLEKRIAERIAELNKTESQLRQLQKMDAIGRLAGGIAHDFNNMLGAISLYSEAIAEPNATPESIQKNIANIQDATNRASALTRQLLVFSRKQIAYFKTISLNPVIQGLEKMLIRLIGENIKITTKLAPNLKDITGDPSQIEQVILNLVVNARDALPNGGNITIETSNIYLDEAFTSTHLFVEKGHYILLRISDDGFGMDQETRNKIFEPFFTTKEVGKGTGLGLSTVYGIIKQNKGTIWVYSEVGKGTVFKIYLPIADQAKEALAPIIPKAKSIENIDTSKSILLVEDDDNLREGFAFVLKKKGFNVHVAANAKEALEICASPSVKVDLLLTDMVMPGMNGYELSKKITDQYKDVLTLYMSGYASDALEGTGVDNLSKIEFIQKPFSTTSLITKIHEVISKKA